LIKQGVIAKAVVFDDHGRILLVRRSKTAPRRPLEWDLPGGFVDNDDGSYREACLRELAEEAGIKDLNGVARLGYAESDFEKSKFDMTWLYFTVQASNAEVKLSYEHDTFEWVTLKHAEELISYDRQLRALAYIRKVKESEKHAD
jgi:8-oxo-dGTP diphosphatase